MHWFLVQTRPRQEERALEHLERQGYGCYLPKLTVHRVRRGKAQAIVEPLFPRYLFIQLGQTLDSMSWAPIRSTAGVTRLVSFGVSPARVDASLVEQLKQREANASPEALFEPGCRLEIVRGPFRGLECVFELQDGDQRVMVLMELLGKPVRLGILIGDVVTRA